MPFDSISAMVAGGIGARWRVDMVLALAGGEREHEARSQCDTLH